MKQLAKILMMPLLLIITSCGSEEKKVEKLIRPVRYEMVGLDKGEKIRTYSGKARTEKIINLSFRTSGIITEHNLNIGQRVKKGQLLAKLDNLQSRLNYESAVASLNSAESQMNTAKLTFNRVRSLYEKGSSSLSDFESSKNSYTTARQSFESAKRSVAIQQDQVSYGYLTAPEDGIISMVNSEIDENVTPGQTVAVLNAGTDMNISLGMPESAINRVQQNMPVQISFSSLPEKVYKGKVTEIAPAVDANTATYPLRVQVTNPTDEIKSGMAANITFDFGDHKAENTILVVPTHAVGEDSNGRFVFLIEENDTIAKVKKHPVTIGNLTANGFEIISGLKTGQKIATAGLQTLLDGQEVRLQ